MDGFVQWALAFVLVASLPFAGQLVGYLSYRLLRKQQDFVAHFVGAAVPPLGFFYQCKWLLAPEGFSSDGTALVAMGLGLQLIFGIVIQLALHNRHKLAGGDVGKLR